ncbi:hypothetical protein THIX_30163 [Thiomonas sp. X19]|nr:hypothetical protein THIX_30163 [Thiomonas sp. X19]
MVRPAWATPAPCGVVLPQASCLALLQGVASRAPKRGHGVNSRGFTVIHPVLILESPQWQDALTTAYSRN